MKLNETINDIKIDIGIFEYISSLNKFSWLTENDAKLIDIEYYLNHSGEKTITPLFESLLSNMITLAQIISLKYGDNWNKLYDAFIGSDYNPLENYSMVENEKVSSKVTHQRNASTGSYGFNSDAAVPTDEGNETNITSGSKDDNQRDLLRSGNIGVTTSQQMLQSEIDLRKWNFYDKMMLDVDHVLTLMIYD